MRLSVVLLCIAVLLVGLNFAVTGVGAATAGDAKLTHQFVVALMESAGVQDDLQETAVSSCLLNNRNIREVDGVECHGNKITIDFEFQREVNLPQLPAGALGPEIAVKEITVDCNDRRGTFPSSWVAMSQLEKLKFDDCILTGVLPCDWTAMSSLNTLELSEGLLSGPLPEFPSGLSKITIEENDFCGTLPSSWSSLPLRDFSFEAYSNNKLCGCAPTWLDQKKLKDELKDLKFEKGCSTKNPTCDGTCGTCEGSGGGTVHESATLRFLRLIGGAFRPLYSEWTGDDWQRWPGISGTQTDVRIDLRSMKLRGALPQLPDDLDGKAVAVSSIDLSDSMTVVGTLPSTWGALAQLQTLKLARTGISGTLPVEWSGMSSLTTLELSDTLICGALPKWSMPALKTVNLSYNEYLRGSLEPSWSSMKSSTVILTNNSFCGSIPMSWKVAGIGKDLVAQNLECSEELNKCTSGSALAGTAAVIAGIAAVTVIILF